MFVCSVIQEIFLDRITDSQSMIRKTNKLFLSFPKGFQEQSVALVTWKAFSRQAKIK